LTIPKKQKIQEPVRSSHKIKKTPTLKITEKPVIQATTETIQTTIEKQNNAHEIDGTLEKIQNMRSALHNEVERLINLEALIKFQRRLQENVNIHKQNITDLVEKYEFLIQQINQLEWQLQQIQEPLIELQSDIESEKSAVQFALHTKDNLPKEQKERIVNLHSSIQKYEAFTKKFNTLEDTIKKVIDDTNGSLRKYQESSRYLISWVQTQLLWANPNELLDINIPENSQNLDLEWLKKKIRYIELLERMILTLVDDSPITDSLKRNVDKILKKIEKKKTSSVVKKKTSEIDVRERVAEPIIQNNTVNISDIPDEVIKALKVLQVASPKPARGQNFWKTLKKLVGYLNISHGNYEPIDPKKEEQAIIWLEQQLDKFSIVFDEISRRPPTKAVLEKHEWFIIKWRFRNGSYMYLLPDTSMKQLDQVSIGDLTETQKLFIRKKVEQEKEDNTQKYVKKSA